MTKVSKWDIKKALKLLGLEVNEQNLSKVDELRGVASNKDTDKQEESQQETLVLTDDSETATIVGIVRVNNNSYNVVKVKVNLREVEVIYNTDSEPRAILERGKAEAELKSLEFRKLKKEGKL